MILGTAGHIDHGKTALIYALTGIETDRLKEERERGISIDLGFAYWDAAPGVRIGIVDVPGHEDFIRNMVAGASGVDAALFVVSAEEGMMPQSREHLEILAQLGVSRGVVALTKRDLVDRDWLELVSEAVAHELAGTFLASAPLLTVSARTGEGLEDLRRAVLALARDAHRHWGDFAFRLPVDRVFTVRGVGTVVTGTPWSGRVRIDDGVRILPGEKRARVRSIESHGEEAPAAEPGQRAALALAGADREWLTRGSAVVLGDLWRGGRLYQVLVDHRPVTPRELRSGARVRILLGTAEVMARLTLEAGRSPLASGAAAFGQLRLEHELVANLGDRFVLRSFSPVETLGGGVVLWRSARKLGPRKLAEAAAFHRALQSADPATRLRAVIGEKGARGASREEACFRAAVPESDAQPLVQGLLQEGAAILESGRVYSCAALEDVRRSVLLALEEFHAREKIRRGMPLGELRERAGAPAPIVERVLRDLLDRGQAVIDHNQVALTGRSGSLGERESAWRDALLARYERAGIEPPALDQALAEGGVPAKAGRSIIELLVEEGILTKVGSGLYFHATSLQSTRATLREFLSMRPLASVSELKELLGVSRKYLIPLLEHFDREGLTRRTGAGRSLVGS
jgi:selenocysteine-specific elongation factor